MRVLIERKRLHSFRDEARSCVGSPLSKPCPVRGRFEVGVRGLGTPYRGVGVLGEFVPSKHNSVGTQSGWEGVSSVYSR